MAKCYLKKYFFHSGPSSFRMDKINLNQKSSDRELNFKELFELIVKAHNSRFSNILSAWTAYIFIWREN